MTDRPGRCQVVLFDFFGTLVEYEPDRRRLHYPETHGLVKSWGHEVADVFVAQWDAASAALEAHGSLHLIRSRVTISSSVTMTSSRCWLRS